MSDRPYIQAALKDGTFQVSVPIRGHTLPHPAKDGFSSEIAAQHWMESTHGKQTIAKIIQQYSKPTAAT